MEYYEVSVANTFEAESHADAVLQMAEWLAEYARLAGYRVSIEDAEGSEFIDAEILYYEKGLTRA